MCIEIMLIKEQRTRDTENRWKTMQFLRECRRKVFIEHGKV